MKKLFTTLMFTLALNFIAVAGAVGWLFQSGHLNHERIAAVRQVLFPPPAVEAPATQPAGPEAPPPMSLRLQELLAKHSIGRSSADQVEAIQQNFDATMAQLDRREREVLDRERQVAFANSKLADDRKSLEAERQKLTDQEQEADRLAADKGFKDTLALYNSMPSRQVKGLFMSMDELSAAQYLDAMPPRSAIKILKEFKTPADLDRMRRILEKMRHPPGGAAPATQEAKE